METVKDTKSDPVEETVEYANEILITKSELEDKNKLVHNLQQQVDETKTESEYQLRSVATTLSHLSGGL